MPPSKYFLPFISIIFEAKGSAEVALRYSIWSNTSFIKIYSAFPVSIFVIRPPEVLKIGRLEKNEDKIQNVYDIGLNTGIKEIDNLLNYLNK